MSRLIRRTLFVFLTSLSIPFLIYLWIWNLPEYPVKHGSNVYTPTLVSGRYCVVYNFTVAEGLFNKSVDFNNMISLTIHSTMNYAHYIVDQADTFADFISFAVLIEHYTFKHVEELATLWYCERKIRRKVSIHLVWDTGLYRRDCPSVSFRFPKRCDEDFERRSAFSLIIPPVLIYPINYLRNIARKGAATGLHVVADVENFFSPKFCQLIRGETAKMLKANSSERYVLVFRRFEMAHLVPRPRTVFDLWTALRKNQANFFHQKFYPRGHYIPELYEWLKYSSMNDTIITTELEYSWKNPAWEPQFVMPANAPFHYEPVATRRYDHQVLVRELCRAGYSFRLLSHVYNIHIGIKTNYTASEELAKRSSRYTAKDESIAFNEYLNSRYPDTALDCPFLF